jgi:membrane-associated phospholipid phosphatase
MSVYVSYFWTPHVMALIVWRLDRTRFRPYAAAILGTFYLALVVSFLAPTAPPWLAAEVGHLPPVTRVIDEIGTQLSPAAYDRAHDAAGPNDVAAMPSLHMAITFVVALAAWRFNRVAGVLGSAYAAAMGFALVYFGEHYVVDLLAGLFVALVVWGVVNRLWGRGGYAPFKTDPAGTEPEAMDGFRQGATGAGSG